MTTKLQHTKCVKRKVDSNTFFNSTKCAILVTSVIAKCQSFLYISKSDCFMHAQTVYLVADKLKRLWL